MFKAARRLRPIEELGEPDKTSTSGPHQRSRTAALSGSHPKAPGSAGGYLQDYDVLEDGVVVGRILFISAAGPADRQWMWASGHNGDIRRAAHGYEPTREAAMQAFARSWRRE